MIPRVETFIAYGINNVFLLSDQIRRQGYIILETQLLENKTQAIAIRAIPRIVHKMNSVEEEE